MSELLQAVLESDEKSDLRQFASELRAAGNTYLLRNDILNSFSDYCDRHQKDNEFHASSLSKLIYYTQEIILEDESLCWIIQIGRAHV